MRHQSSVGGIVTGTGGGAGMPLYRWARCGIWSLKYWPDGGGAQGYVNIGDPFGDVVDVDDEMPADVWAAMLSVVGAPVDPGCGVNGSWTAGLIIRTPAHR